MEAVNLSSDTKVPFFVWNLVDAPSDHLGLKG